MRPNIVAIIPARMNSSRFPGKPLAKILGTPMIEHVYKRTASCPLLADTFVATCDQEIFSYINAIGGKAVMTSSTHERATDRAAEAMLKIEEDSNKHIDIVVMVQGDEPMVSAQMIEKSLQPFMNSSATKIVNLTAPILSTTELNDPNIVKVVVDQNYQALYFSREPIPSIKKCTDTPALMLKQVAIIPFKRDYLLYFNQLDQTPLEIIESIDMLRILENREPIQMVLINEEAYSVDTPADLKLVEKKLMPLTTA